MKAFAAKIFKVLCKIWSKHQEDEEEEIIWKIEMCKYNDYLSSSSFIVVPGIPKRCL